MNEPLQESRTVAIKTCAECRAGLLERDRFCRWCGSRQPLPRTLEVDRGQATAGATSYVTVALAAGAGTDVYRRISGPLISAVVGGALSAPSTESQSAFIKRLILALISIPVWLIIVLLSPLDAYATVKNLARQV
jgi:ribosomal protein L40E